MERLGTATWPEGWDHDPGEVFSGRALREASEIQLEVRVIRIPQFVLNAGAARI
jgi:hypothetical protein